MLLKCHLVAIYHSLVVLIYISAVIHSFYNYVHYSRTGLCSNRSANGYIAKFMTYWDVTILIITFSISLVCDLSSDATENSRIFRIRNKLFNSLAQPMAFFVSITFWGMLAIVKDSVRSNDCRLSSNPWKNHTVHTLPIVVVVIDIFLVDHKRRDEKNGLIPLWTVIFGYLTYLSLIGCFRDDWVYPILVKSNPWMRIAIFLGIFIGTSIYYYLGGFLYDFAWSKKNSTIKDNEKQETLN